MNLFVVGKIAGESWEFMGIFDDQDLAEKQCIDERYFVGPCELNKNLGEETIDWPGGYYPKSGDIEK